MGRADATHAALHGELADVDSNINDGNQLANFPIP
jgi:hypothetical protein